MEFAFTFEELIQYIYFDQDMHTQNHIKNIKGIEAWWIELERTLINNFMERIFLNINKASRWKTDKYLDACKIQKNRFLVIFYSLNAICRFCSNFLILNWLFWALFGWYAISLSCISIPNKILINMNNFKIHFLFFQWLTVLYQIGIHGVNVM